MENGFATQMFVLSAINNQFTADLGTEVLHEKYFQLS